MRKKIIITESQLSKLNYFIMESTRHELAVKEVSEELSKNYRKALETYRDANEYKQRKVFEIRYDGQLISPENLLKYFKLKYNYGDKFLEQIITDWCDDNIKDGRLSKNVGLTE